VADLSEIRARIAEIAARDEDEFDVLACRAGLSKRQRVEFLQERRTRYLGEAAGIVTRSTGDPNPTQELLATRLLDHVDALDVEIARLAEQARADEQHAETVKRYAPEVGFHSTARYESGTYE
jgi:hypothetical protein